MNISSLVLFRWVARVALLCSCVCFGLVRTQTGLLFKYELGFSESDFGMVIMVMSLANFAVFAAAGRWNFWHYRPAILGVAQILMVLSLVLILCGGTLRAFFMIAGTLGIGGGFIYSSHLYYGVTGSKRRSARMAIHETTLSLGIVIGALVGGYLSEHLSPYAPYWFGISILGIGFLAQIVLWFTLKPGKNALTPSGDDLKM